MAATQLNIDLEYFDKEVDFSDLKEATNRLTSASESQFAQIQNETWYNRVFDAVTFSKKKEKRLAANISNLAQAQQVLMELLIRLSTRDTKIAALVEDSFDKIAELSAQNVKIAGAVKILRDRCILGLEKSSDIGDLSVINKEILAGILLLVTERLNALSEAQQKYNDAVLRYINIIDPQHIDLAKTLNEVGEVSIRRKMLVCAMELAFLGDLSFDFVDSFSDIIDEFDFGGKTIRDIKASIQKSYKLRGVDGFYNKYGHMDYEISDTFVLDIGHVVKVEDIEKQNQQDATSNVMSHDQSKVIRAQRTPMIIDTPFTVHNGEVKIISDKDITISAQITVHGTLEFSNCEINAKTFVKTNDGNTKPVIVVKGIFSAKHSDFKAIKLIECPESFDKIELVDCRFVNTVDDYKDSGLNKSWFDTLSAKQSNSAYTLIGKSIGTRTALLVNPATTYKPSDIYLHAPYHGNKGIEIFDCHFIGTSNIKVASGVLKKNVFESTGAIFFTDSYSSNKPERAILECKFIDIPHVCIDNADEIRNCEFTATKCFEPDSRYGFNRFERSGDGLAGYIDVQMTRGGTVISDCNFSNLEFKSIGYYYLFGHKIFKKKSTYTTAKVVNCVFEKCKIKSDAKYLLPQLGRSNDFIEKDVSILTVVDCKFIQCSPEK